MHNLRWSPTFETGVAEIDDDHRAMFALATEIGDGIAKQDAGFRTALQQFIALAELHFAKEEDILVRAGYPNVDRHKAYHTALLTKARQLKAVCDRKDDPAQAGKCYGALVEFLIDDVVRGDTQFKSFLDAEGLTGK